MQTVWLLTGSPKTTMRQPDTRNLLTRFREKAPVYSSVTNWFRRLDFAEDIFEPGIHSGKPSDDLVDFKILTELTAFPFHSVRTLAGTLKIPRSTI
jgi:hypothetical protein